MQKKASAEKAIRESRGKKRRRLSAQQKALFRGFLHTPTFDCWDRSATAHANRANARGARFAPQGADHRQAILLAKCGQAA